MNCLKYSGVVSFSLPFPLDALLLLSLGGALGDALGDALGGALGGALGDALGDALRAALGVALGGPGAIMGLNP